MAHLYELTKELTVINDELITAEGEITPDLEKRLDQVNLALTEKATGIRKWRAMIDTDTSGLDAEISRLQKMKKIKVNLADRLDTYVKGCMEAADLKKIETPIGTFAIQKNPPSVEIVSEEMVPAEFQTVIPEQRVPDKKKIIAALKDGYDVPGAKYIDDRTHLRVK